MTRQQRTFAKRLLKLASFLDKLPRKRFNFTHWAGLDWQGKPDLSCGTTACAFGWSTTIPAFRRLGLRMYKHNYADDLSVPWIGMKGDHRYNAAPRAAKAIFGLNYDEFTFLFIPTISLPENASAKDVAKNIRRFVKHKYGVVKA